MKLPFEIQEVEGKLREAMLRDFKGAKDGFVQVGPQKYFLPKKYKKDVNGLRLFKPRPDDVWIVSFPRSGTTWTQELLWLLCNELNFEKAKSIPIADRFPCFEYSTFICDDFQQQLLDETNGDVEKRNAVEESAIPAFEMLAKEKSPRFIQTHLPFSLLPPDLIHSGAKIIYVARNPKDVAVSYFHLHKLFRIFDFQRDFSQFWNYFESNLVSWGPYWSHIKEGWQMHSHPNVCFIFYEELSRDLKGTILKLGDFLNKKLTDDGMSKLLEHLHISNFRLNPSVNAESFRKLGHLNEDSQAFIRQGKIDGSEEYYAGDLNERAQKWIDWNIKQIDGFQFLK